MMRSRQTARDETDAVTGSAPRRSVNLMPGNRLAVVTRPGSPARLLGQVLVFLGFLAALVAWWFLWGSGLATVRQQHRLSSQFSDRLVAAAATTTIAPAAMPATALEKPVDWEDDPSILITNEPPAPVAEPEHLVREEAPPPGEALGRLLIPAAGVDWIVVEGTAPEHLTAGPGHVINSAMPGQAGNAVISGHRTTFGAPFYHLDRVARGDLIEVVTLIGLHTYEVVDTRVILPTDLWVATQWEGSWLTLTTCHPRFASTRRLVVISRLIAGPNVEAFLSRPASDLPVVPAG